MPNYAGTDDKYCAFDSAKTLLQSIPYDGTSTWGKGADQGFDAFLDASENMELYDIETRSEAYKQGIHILPEIDENKSPEAMFNAVYKNTQKLLETDKFLTFFGGEHSISIGIIRAFYENFPDITILQLDAHADLRPEYGGTPYNHACAVFDASQHCNLVQVGIRSMDESENENLKPSHCFFAHEMHDKKSWMKNSLDLLTDQVYITLDLDVFDPSIMQATGTPEPGGMDWYTMMEYLRLVFNNRNVLGFDIVELAPIRGIKSSEFLAAKLYYKMLSYKFEGHGR